jgi:toxin ParE1/3/4
MRLRYTAEAREHVTAIYAYIRDRNPVAATQVAARIRFAAERLAEFRRMGRAGRVPGPMNWWYGLPYIIVYEVGAAASDELLILGIFHAAQNRE